MNIEKIKEEFLAYNQSIAPTTLKSYKWAFDKIIRLWNKYPATDMDKVSKDEVKQFLSLLYNDVVSKQRPKEGYPEGFTSYFYIKMFLKRVFKYLGREDIVKIIKEKSLESPDIKPLTYEEVNIVIRMLPDIEKKEREKILLRQKEKGRPTEAITDAERDKQIISMLYATGLRASELASLKIGDVLFESKMGKIKGKGRIRTKDNFYFLFGYEEKLKEWLGSRIDNKNEFIFLSKDHKQFTYYNLWKLIKLISIGSGIQFRCHTLRHSIGVYLVKNGWSPETIRKFLRHRNVSTTGIYLKERGEEDVLQAMSVIKEKI